MRAEKPSKLPWIALGLDVLPFLAIWLLSLTELALLPVIFFPILGVFLGFASLFQSEKRLGKLGFCVSLIAALLPIIFVVTIIMMMAVGNVISLM